MSVLVLQPSEMQALQVALDCAMERGGVGVQSDLDSVAEKIQRNRRGRDQATEEERDEASRILSAAYFADVRRTAERIVDEIRSGNIEDRGELFNAIRETVDGHRRVFITYKAIETVLYSPNASAGFDGGLLAGDLADTDLSQLMTQIAYAAFEQDVLEQLERMDVDVNEEEPPFGLDDDEDGIDGLGASFEKDPHTDEPYGFDEFFSSYVETALWASTDDSGESLDIYSEEDIDPDGLSEMRRDAKDFYEEMFDVINDDDNLLTGADVHLQAGHDFFLTRNGHGAGFWDGDWKEPAASELTKAAEGYGAQDLMFDPETEGIYVSG